MHQDTYEPRLSHGIVRLVNDLHKADELPKPMFEIRLRFLNRLSIDEKKLAPFDREAFKCRFRNAMNTIEGIHIESQKGETDKGTPLRLISYKIDHEARPT